MTQPTSTRGTVVLLVDDDRDVREAFAYFLWLSGYEVREARDGTEALYAMRTERPAVVILDLMMPQVDGREVRRQMEADAALAAIPTIILSGASDLDDLPGCVVMRKPAEPDQLLRAVRVAMETAAGA